MAFTSGSPKNTQLRYAAFCPRMVVRFLSSSPESLFLGVWVLDSSLPTPGPDFTVKFLMVGLEREVKCPMSAPLRLNIDTCISVNLIS